MDSGDLRRVQLQRVLESKAFAGSARMRQLLQFIVEHALRFPEEPLKEILIGTELYASGSAFDRA
jgi:hypothetical protein